MPTYPSCSVVYETCHRRSSSKKCGLFSAHSTRFFPPATWIYPQSNWRVHVYPLPVICLSMNREPTDLCPSQERTDRLIHPSPSHQHYVSKFVFVLCLQLSCAHKSDREPDTWEPSVRNPSARLKKKVLLFVHFLPCFPFWEWTQPPLLPSKFAMMSLLKDVIEICAVVCEPWILLVQSLQNNYSLQTIKKNGEQQKQKLIQW